MSTPLSHYAEILKLTSLQPPSPASGSRPDQFVVNLRMAEALLNNSKQQSPRLIDLGQYTSKGTPLLLLDPCRPEPCLGVSTWGGVIPIYSYG